MFSFFLARFCPTRFFMSGFNETFVKNIFFSWILSSFLEFFNYLCTSGPRAGPQDWLMDWPFLAHKTDRRTGPFYLTRQTRQLAHLVGELAHPSPHKNMLVCQASLPCCRHGSVQPSPCTSLAGLVRPAGHRGTNITWIRPNLHL